MQLATWNVNSLNVRLGQVLAWLDTHAVDVLALQELKMTADKFPSNVFLSAGYHAQFLCQKTYNGVALLTRTPVTEVVKNIPNFDDSMARVIAGMVGDIRVVGAYFPNGQEPGTEAFAYKMRWLAALRNWIECELQLHPKLVLMGDYNITFDDADVWDPQGMREQIHCTEAERAQLRALIALGLHDSLRLIQPTEKNYSWWDYRNFAWQRNRGLRIDHILVSNALKPRVADCAVDKAPRKNPRPSDHAPVVLTLTPPN